MTEPKDPIEGLTRLLGPDFVDEPSSAQLSAYLAGELEDAAASAEAASYLQAHPELAERLRGALRWADALERERPATCKRLLPISSPSLRAAAASRKEQGPPMPEERRVLIDEGGLRVVYWREAQRAQLGIFRSSAGPDLGLLTPTLDDRALELLEEREDGRIFDLGAPAILIGRELTLEITGSDDEARSWLLVEDETP